MKKTTEVSTTINNKKLKAYEADNFKFHKHDVDKVRVRCAMYMGGNPIHQCVKEVVDNAVDEFGETNQGSKKWNVYILYKVVNGKHCFTVADRGRGIPVEKNKDIGMSTLTGAFTQLQGGGKFDSKSYEAGKGTNGTGVCATNALSEQLEVWTHRNGVWYYQAFKKGKPTTEVISNKNPAKEFMVNKCGTVVTFTVDNTIEQIAHDTLEVSTLKHWLDIMSMIDSPIKILFEYVNKKQIKKSIEYYQPDGAVEYLRIKLEENKLETLGKKPFHISSKFGTVVCQWASTDETLFEGYTNGVYNRLGGTHVEGFYNALVKSFNIAQANKKKELKLADLRAGIVGFINVRLAEAQYAGQVKDELKSPVRKQVEDFLVPELVDWFKKNKLMVKEIFDRAMALRNAKEQSKKIMKAATAIKDNRRGAVLPGILTACDPKCPASDREIMFVEGDSAAGCFAGETKVRLSDGSSISFIEMVKGHAEGKVYEGYAFDIEEGRSVTCIFDEPRITKYVDELIEVTLEDGSVELCTTDHPWLLDSGHYLAAEDLTTDCEIQEA